jgi:hypothetical protein
MGGATTWINDGSDVDGSTTSVAATSSIGDVDPIPISDKIK